MHWILRLQLLALTLGACTLSGCNMFKGPWYDPFLILPHTHTYTGNNTMLYANTGGSRPTPGVRIATPKGPRVQLLMLTLPVGTFSGNEAIWRQLDQDVLDSQTSVLLAENGIRAAVAPQDRWPALHKLIDVPGAANQQFVLETDGRASVDIITHRNIAQQTISSIDREREMHVRSFDRCDNSIRLALATHRNTPEMNVQLEPVVQMGTITVLRSPQEPGINRNDQRQEETFANLRLSAPLEPNQFLVLSPSNPKNDNFSVGSRFLTDSDAVPAVETILIFIPMRDKPSANSVRGQKTTDGAVANER